MMDNSQELDAKCHQHGFPLPGTVTLQITPSERTRWGLFAGWVALACLLFSRPLYSLALLALRDDTYSHIPLIPLFSLWVFYVERRQQKQSPGSLELIPAALFLLPGVLIAAIAALYPVSSQTNRLSLYVFALILIGISGFVLFLGAARARSSKFALAFWLFAVPIPTFLLNKIIYWLQSGSADVAEVIFNLSGAPVLREGFIFRLPRISIDVAPECSGIRSSLALVILAVLLSHFAFRPFWKRAAFVCAGLCMMLIKNGIRIATLTLLANFVNPDFLYGRLHRQGGVVFFLVGLTLLIPVFLFLRRGEAEMVVASPQGFGSSAS